jgi:hypothetical protein
MFGIYIIKRGGPWTGTSHTIIGYGRAGMPEGVAKILGRCGVWGG